MGEGILAGKRGLIMGVANERSSAWGIAAAAAEAGAELAFTYQMEGFGKRLRPLAESVGSELMVECDHSFWCTCVSASARQSRA